MKSRMDDQEFGRCSPKRVPPAPVTGLAALSPEHLEERRDLAPGKEDLPAVAKCVVGI